MAEQRYKAVLAVVADGRTITEVAASWGISRRTLQMWLLRDLVVSRSGVRRALLRAGLIESGGRRRRQEHLRRWDRGRAMELWQMDVVGGFALADGSLVEVSNGDRRPLKVLRVRHAAGRGATPTGL